MTNEKFNEKCMQYVYEKFMNANEDEMQALCDFFGIDEIEFSEILSEKFEQDLG